MAFRMIEDERARRFSSSPRARFVSVDLSDVKKRHRLDQGTSPPFKTLITPHFDRKGVKRKGIKGRGLFGVSLFFSLHQQLLPTRHSLLTSLASRIWPSLLLSSSHTSRCDPYLSSRLSHFSSYSLILRPQPLLLWLLSNQEILNFRAIWPRTSLETVLKSSNNYQMVTLLSSSLLWILETQSWLLRLLVELVELEIHFYSRLPTWLRTGSWVLIWISERPLGTLVLGLGVGRFTFGTVLIWSIGKRTTWLSEYSLP